MEFALTILPDCAPLSLQGHILAAQAIGDIYYWGKGVAIDYPRAMAAYKIAAEAGDALSQYQVGLMYFRGHGVAVDYEQARSWFEKAAAQDDPHAVCQLGYMYYEGKGVASSWRRARELYKRAIELGNSEAVKYMQDLTQSIAAVTNVAESNLTPHTQIHSHKTPTSVRPIPSRSSPPSWTSGWRSTARAAPT